MIDPNSPSTVEPPKSFHQNVPHQLLALLIWVLAWLGVQSLLVLEGLNAGQQVTAFLLLAAGIFGAGFLARRAWLYQLLTSVPFAVSQLLFLAFAGLLNAMMPAAKSLKALDSLWMFGLLLLLAVSMLCVAWKRRPYPAHRIGFLLVHTSTSLIFMGGLLGMYSGLRASRELRIGEPVSSFAQREDGSDSQRIYPLPGFSLRLDRVTIAKSRPDFQLYAFVEPDEKGGFEKKPKACGMEIGKPFHLPHSKLLCQVEKIISNALDAGEFTNDPQAPENPALRVMLGIGGQQPLVGDLFARDASKARRDEPGGRFAVVYQDRWTEDLLNRLRPAPPTSEKLVASYQGMTLEHEAKVGGAWDFPAFSLKVEKAYPDFAIQKDQKGNPVAYSRSPNPVEPWLELNLRDSGGSRRVMLSANHPEISDRLNAPNLPKGLGLRYLREGEEVQSQFVVFTREDRTARLVENGRVARSESFSLGQPFVIRRGLSVTPVAVLDHAKFAPDFIAFPDPNEAKQFERPVMKVKVWDPGSGKSEEKWLDAKNPEGRSTPELFFNGSVRLAYQPAITEPQDVRSALVVLDMQGKRLAEKDASLGDPLVFRGHRFFPDASPMGPGAIVITMVSEPWLWLTYSGFLLLLVGVAWMFYLKPVLKRRAPAKQEA